MKTIINKHTLLLSVLRDKVEDFGRDYVEREIITLIAPSFSDERLAGMCNTIVLRKGFFTSK